MHAAPAFLAMTVLVSIAKRVHGGSCWQRMSASGHCTGMLMDNTTKEKCCSLSLGNGQQTYWVEQNLDSGRLFYYTYFARGVPGCAACHGNCDTLKCSANERCRMRGGHPRCVCSPNCSAIHEALGGGIYKGAICATDGRTYRSHCALLRSKCKQPYSSVEAAYMGECQAQSCANVTCIRESDRCIVDQFNMPHCVACQSHCPTQGVSPVCGSDGLTYKSGICGIAQQNCRTGAAIVKQYDGECRGNVTCGAKNCEAARNGRCLYDSHSGKSVCMRCPPDCDPSDTHSSYQMPICGTDGNNYRNWCQMRVQACQLGQNVQTLHAGECGAVESRVRQLVADYYRRHEESLVVEYTGEEEARHRKRGAKRKSVLS